MPAPSKAEVPLSGSSDPPQPPKRAKPSSPRLTLPDAIEIWKRRRLGEAIHTIAAAFQVNAARISEVLSGKRFPDAERLSLI